MPDKKSLEEGLIFTPQFDQNGLIPCITTDADDGDVLMFAFMNQEALEKTLETGEAHYWSRSRACLWHKGASSGYTQKIIEMRTDCDQDCIWIKVRVTVPEGKGEGHKAACHTGRKTCFYREVTGKPDTEDEESMRFLNVEEII